jgi:3-hydroxyacyl-CoA dehydrogenase
MIDRIEKVGVLGAGLMGHGIAQLAAQAGCQVVLVDVSEQELQKGWAKIQKLWNKDVEKGKLTPEQLDGLTKLIDTSLDINDFADCDVVIEAIPEIMELKKETFTKLDQIVKPDAILATNTSQLSITEIARFSSASKARKASAN